MDNYGQQLFIFERSCADDTQPLLGQARMCSTNNIWRDTVHKHPRFGQAGADQDSAAVDLGPKSAECGPQLTKFGPFCRPQMWADVGVDFDQMDRLRPT